MENPCEKWLGGARAARSFTAENGEVEQEAGGGTTLG